MLADGLTVRIYSMYLKYFFRNEDLYICPRYWTAGDFRAFSSAAQLRDAFCVSILDALLLLILVGCNNQPTDVATAKIFVVGGFDSSATLKTVEVYDIRTRTWNMAPPLPSPRRRLGAATLKGKLYAIGGWDETELQTVDVFDPPTNSWTSAPKMNVKRNAAAVAVLDEKIYAVGGASCEGNFAALSSVEIFDPQSNSWTIACGRLNTARYHVAVDVLFGGRYAVLYAVGGSNEIVTYETSTGKLVSTSGGTLKTVEKLNPATGVWSFVAPMKVMRFNLNLIHTCIASILNGSGRT